MSVYHSGELPLSILKPRFSSWTGSLNLPLTKAESVNYIQSWRAKFEKAEDIVIVGGGAVGIGMLQDGISLISC